MFKELKIGTKLVLMGALILIAALGTVGYVSITDAKAGMVALEYEQLTYRTKELANAVENVLKVEQKLVKDLSIGTTTIESMSALRESSTENRELFIDKLSNKLKRFKNTEGLGEDYQVVFIADLDGNIIAASDASYLGTTIRDRGYFQSSISGTTGLGKPDQNKITGEPFIPISTPIISESDEIVGSIAVILKLEFLTNLIADATIGETGYAFITDADGKVIAHPNEEILFKQNVKELEGMEAIAQKMLAGEAGVEEYVYEGVDKTAGFAPVEMTGWSLTLTLSNHEFLAPVTEVRNKILFIAFAALVIAFLIFVFFSRSISKPIREGVSFAGTVAEGDLEATLDVKHKDEIGELADALRRMIGKLKQIVWDIRSASDQVSYGSQQLSATAEQLSQGANEQAASVEEVSSSMEQMSSNINQNADNATETEKIAIQAAQDAEESGEAVLKAVEAMNQIAEKIVIIEEISRSTNMLSLNASIEAARAGEHGKGFAVVASEVGKLAARSKEAAGEISELSSSTVSVAEKARQMLEQLVPNIRKTADLVQEISAASREQSSGAEQINTAIGQLDMVVQQNASASEEMASVAEELTSQAEELQETISYFHINAAEAGYKTTPKVTSSSIAPVTNQGRSAASTNSTAGRTSTASNASPHSSSGPTGDKKQGPKVDLDSKEFGRF